MQTKCQCLIFLHIPKAGGSTLHSILEKQYSANNTFTIQGKTIDSDINKLKQIPPLEKKKIKCIKGHLPYGLHKYMPQQCCYITILRNPVTRIISDYYYHLYKSKNFIHDIIIKEKISLNEYIKSNLSINQSNIQTRLISGMTGPLLSQNPKPVPESLLIVAKNNLENHFKAIGLMEKYDESLLLFKKRLGWQKTILYCKKNVNKKKNNNITTETLQIIKKYNKLDIELYNFAKQIFEQQLNNQTNYFYIELKKFKRKQACYSQAMNVVNQLTQQKNKIITIIKNHIKFFFQ